MPHDPVIVRQDVIEKSTFGGHDLVVLTKREAPCGPNGEVLDDPFQEYDEWVAHKMMSLLNTVYPGYPWTVKHDTVYNAKESRYDKLARISIPILMGINNYMAVNERTDELTPGIIIATAHEILERYNLPERFHLDRFLEARQKHSALVVTSRLVPE